MFNYRQYEGKIIAEISQEPGKNIIIFEGENGTGKSNFLNAISWLFWGIEPLLTMESKSLPILNQKCEGNEAYVKIRFKNPEILLQRDYITWKHNGRNSDKTILRFQDLSGTNQFFEGREAELKVSKILTEGLRNYYLFNGEDLKGFFEGDTKVVKDAVFNASQLNLLNRTINHLENTADFIITKKKQKNGFSEEITELQEIVTRRQRNLEINKRELVQFRELKKDTKLELHEVNDKLKKVETMDLQELENDRERLRHLSRDYSNKLNYLNKDFSKLILFRGPLILAAPEIAAAFKLIKDYHTDDPQQIKPKLPRGYKKPFLEDLLKLGNCICGADLINDTIHREKILELIMQKDVSRREEIVTEAMYKLTELINLIKIFNVQYYDFESEILDIETKKKDNDTKLNEIDRKIGSLPEQEIRKLQQRRKELEKDLDLTAINEGVCLQRKSIYEGQVKKANENLTKKLEEESKYRKLLKRRELINSSIKVIKDIKNKIMKETKEHLESKLNQIYNEIIWKEEKFKIHIDEEYNLSIYLEDGDVDMLGSLSAGETEVLAFSFLAALSSISGFEFPIIIDTLFGRISRQTRINFTKMLPKILSDRQVIILVTDTEFTPDLREILKPNIAKYYKINYDKIKKNSQFLEINI